MVRPNVRGLMVDAKEAIDCVGLFKEMENAVAQSRLMLQKSMQVHPQIQ